MALSYHVIRINNLAQFLNAKPPALVVHSLEFQFTKGSADTRDTCAFERSSGRNLCCRNISLSIPRSISRGIDELPRSGNVMDGAIPKAVVGIQSRYAFLFPKGRPEQRHASIILPLSKCGVKKKRMHDAFDSCMLGIEVAGTNDGHLVDAFLCEHG